jgi:peptidoglycan-N-acetylglucosamine deacetylase
MKFKGLYIFVKGKSAFIFLMLICIFFTLCNNVEAVNMDSGGLEGEQVIYLTFDDGPSVITGQVLDILREHDIKATFFLIGNQVADKMQRDVVKRMHEEGHSIGLRSYTHNFKRIYSSNQNFIDEMFKCQNEIYSITGIKPNIIRFPWGSRKRLKPSFSNILHDNNLKVYDWNAYMSDGINYKTSVNKLYREATKTTVSEHPIILLMHCDYMHKNTCRALPMVIKYYKERNYVFKIITE